MSDAEAAGGAHTPYTITADEESEELAPSGQFQDVHRISFTTPSGGHGYVRIPDANYSAENVHQLVQEKADEKERVLKLQGGTPPAAPPAA